MLTKRRKVDAECRAFNKESENKYFFEQTAQGASLAFFINNFGKTTCLIYNVSVSVNKEFSIKRLYDTNHTNFSKFTGQAKKTNSINLESPQNSRFLYLKGKPLNWKILLLLATR